MFNNISIKRFSIPTRNICPVTMKFRNEVVQNYPQESIQFTHAENVTVNNTAYFSGTEPADSDADTDDNDSNDNWVDDDNEGNVCFTVTNTCYNKYE